MAETGGERMSILIKGMKMPEKGYVDVRIFAEGHANIAAGEAPFFKELPTIEIPPHGDLIDRDELDDWVYAIPIFTSDENPDVWKVIRLDDIDNAPTVIEAEGE